MVRELVVLAFLVLSATLWSSRCAVADAPGGLSKIVFVCEHGSVKSLVAASYFNRSAEARGLPYRAVARGTAPEASVPMPVRDGLREIGVDVSSYVPQLFQSSDLDGASLVVSFDQDVTPIVRGRVRQSKWDDLPALLPSYSRGRDAIVRQVNGLIELLAQHRLP